MLKNSINKFLTLHFKVLHKSDTTFGYVCVLLEEAVAQ